MSIIPVLLADAEKQNQNERAVELYALAESQAFIANSKLFEDIAGEYIATATADLPPAVAAATQERGRALHWWGTAERLLVELREMGWENASDL